MMGDGDGSRDVDAAFAEIVSRWDEVESLPEAPTASGSSAAGTSLEPGVPPSTVPDSQPPESTAPEAPLAETEDEAEDEIGDEIGDEHFVPGPTAPLPPQEDVHFWGIIVGLVGGPVLLLWLVLLRPNVSSWWALLAVALSVGGFALLVLRQPRHREPDDPDDGARL